ncbi:predicted protein [Phaeodactylum tricornutum CCAP 1055/1]|uniref:Vacuolar membrane-associated protein Iml1 N-terminal domain-containing protein n=1 Tax=Phaeodactylum tricornutum (strain CCAP 1055/1) TaxID=556484 RepID=B7G6Z0_PHATC|nr:predicted protein [Phaeodactylum tricornutum CCAP 1055/1]EEC45548.1 predicted protein [Phaeodactylum tricornutum CCAP 1055/1]|eukprot:XP_002182812.1 predicted protein [Phaeodactylum tricornutum CCAP 1055/1]
MIISKLVSLNVHEALTFEGTEICLHPDLFSASTGNDSVARPGKDPRLLLVSVHSTDENWSVNNNNPAASLQAKLLHVGDMIEIRVWDPLPQPDTTPSSSVGATSWRKRPTLTPSHSMPVTSAHSSTSSHENIGVNHHSSDHLNEALSGATISDVGKLEGLDDGVPRRASLQYSASAGAGGQYDNKETVGDNFTDEQHRANMAAVEPSPIQPAPAKSASSARAILTPATSLPEDSSPAKSITTPGELPPVFPRNRTNTVDGPANTTVPRVANVVPKPPIAQRRISANAPAENMQGKSRTTRASLHSRELSDMTLETVYPVDHRSATVLDSSNHLVDLQVPFGSSVCVPSEDEDDFHTDIASSHSLRLSFVMKVTEQTLTSLKGSARTQVSLLRQIADLYELSSYDMVTIHKVENEEEEAALAAVSADFVLVTIKDQFISRGDMHLFQQNLMGSWIYEGQRLFDATRGIHAHAREIRHDDHQARSGIVTQDTMITYRSRSSRIFWLIQISAEMWDYSSPYANYEDESRCEVYFDKFVKFAYELFAKWKVVEATHSLTVVFFSRTFLPSRTSVLPAIGNRPADQRDAYGRRYEDHYNIVIENETNADWDALVLRMKEAFLKYPYEVEWNCSAAEDARRPSTATQGNVLEAINVTLNLLQYHFLDRDLHRTGNSILVVSAGGGVFEVDKELASITYQRMMDHGIGSDMLSLGLPPLHIAPFFLYVNAYRSVGKTGIDAGESYYEVPHWMHLSFVSYPSDSTIPGSAPEQHDTQVTSVSSFPYGMDVGPNGFLRSQPPVRSAGTRQDTSPLLRPLSFSAHGNAAASPTKKKVLNQERHLIAGRDFYDILEALKPDRRSDSEEASKPREWGALGLPDHRPSDSSSSSACGILSPSLRYLATGRSLQKMEHIEHTDAPEKTASPSSSYTSQFSSVLGVSYDRPLLAQQLSPSRIQMQRTPSQDMILVDDDNCNYDEASPRPSHSDNVVLELDESSEALVSSAHQTLDKIEDRLRKSMRSSDANSFQVSSPKAMTSSDSRSGLPMRDIDSRSRHSISTSTKAGNVSGGIGAALTRYSSAGSSSSHNLEAQGVQRLSVRSISSTRLLGQSPGMRPLFEMNSRGLSPLILPPPRSYIDPLEVQPLSFTGGGRFGGRLIHPSEMSRPFLGHNPNNLHHRTKTESSHGSSSSKTFSTSPPMGSASNSLFHKSAVSQPNRSYTHDRGPSRGKTGQASRRKSRALNPFRQEDEDEVLAKKSHNRRRWSHVFPLGEVEFKRHAGPNWKSLSSPAILPLSVDYFPPQQDIVLNFQFNIYNVTLSEFEHTNYSSNRELLDEMVRQRLTQDYQLVPPSHVNASNYRSESVRDNLANRQAQTKSETENPEIVRKFLSMGHRLQVLTYDPASDTVEVNRYNAKGAEHNTASNSFKYYYYGFCKETHSYTKVVQSFDKYSHQYNWNKVDRMVCGDVENRELEDSMRARRIMFGLIPERFEDINAEQEYISKFHRLLGYLDKLRERIESDAPLEIKIISSQDSEGDEFPVAQLPSKIGIERESMRRFYVQLRKGKRDSFEWMEVAVDRTFNTSWSYRLMFNWLVASSGKVDTQIQLLQRRCLQYGLNLVPFLQVSVSTNVFLNPFRPPAILAIREETKASLLDAVLINNDYVYDGVFTTDAQLVAECMEVGTALDFGKSFGKRQIGRQFVHRSGTLFVRIVNDKQGFALLIVFGNYRYVGRDELLVSKYRKAFFDLKNLLNDLVDDDDDDNIEVISPEKHVKESQIRDKNYRSLDSFQTTLP